MSEEVNNPYGYGDDTPSQASLIAQFGLNAGKAKLVKFEWINNGGKDGAEAEALEIQFTTEGSTRSVGYRMFPITKAFMKDGTEVTDVEAPEFQKALKDFNSCITHILHAFVDTEVIKTAFSTRIANFKDFCKIAMNILPKNYSEIPLDIFFQWGWQINGDAKQTYLELPKKMAHGKWLCKAIAPQAGPVVEGQETPAAKWVTMVHPDPDSNMPIALKYVDGAGNIHPFTRNGWFMLSSFAKKQVAEGSATTEEGHTAIETEASTGDAPKQSVW